MSTTTNIASSAPMTLKQRQRAMWALGDYPAVAEQVIPALGHRLVQACGVVPDQRVLDVAAGSGNAAVPAAEVGARVVASDLTPELFDAGRRLAAARGVDVDWREADAEALPFGEAEFDVVMSCVGVMFTPDHQASADELVRVARPGGVVGLINWTPQGFIGRMLAAVKPFLPAPPANARPAPLWGDPDHVRGLFGDRVARFSATRASLRVDRFEAPEDFRDFFAARYGPIVAARRGLADDPARLAELDEALIELARTSDVGDGGPLVMDWEYLLVTAHRV
ncbi:MAG: class I SAM-dependent methyltransferase [Kineosporiaceae bacterium]|nr:class I SAM-dependent methyltransferase [Kineosporiaceae bacterium]